MAVEVVSTKVLYPPMAACEGCAWIFDDADAPKVRREVRKHVQQQRHVVRITWEYATVYRPVPVQDGA